MQTAAISQRLSVPRVRGVDGSLGMAFMAVLPDEAFAPREKAPGTGSFRAAARALTVKAMRRAALREPPSVRARDGDHTAPPPRRLSLTPEVVAP
jgi:hypothetical protein